MMKPPKGMLNRMIAITSRSLNSTHRSVLGQGHGLHPSFWSAKYSHQDGRNPIRPMASIHRKNASTTALVHVHSKSRTNVWKRTTPGCARSFTPCGMNLAASFIDRGPSRERRADHIAGSPDPPNIRGRDRPWGGPGAAGGL